MEWIACSDRVPWNDVGRDVAEHPGWCRDPVIPDGEGIGFIACEEDLDVHHFERRLRAAGFDPLAVPLVRLSALDRASPGRIEARVAVAAARAAAYAGSGPEHLKPVMPSVVSRRSFLSFRLPAYRTVPHPDIESCGAADGCRACVEVCPHEALDWSQGKIVHDRLACAGCGRCITVCPVGAMVNPAFTPTQFQAELAALASAAVGRFGVLFHCVRMKKPADRAGWFRMAVPCVGMLPANWVLAPLFEGAAAASVVECECGLESDSADRAAAAVEGARDWLRAAGVADAGDRITGSPGDSLPDPIEVKASRSGFEPGGGAAIAAVLGQAVWESDAAPVGVITIDDELCTGCEMCATVCPADALVAAPANGALEITFDPNRCTACGQCASRCPESGAIHLRPAVDSDELKVGRRSLVVHSLVPCVRCGGTVAPRAVLDRIAEHLEDTPAALTQVTSLCPDCRGTTMLF